MFDQEVSQSEGCLVTRRAFFSRPAAFGPYIYMEDDLKTISAVFFHLIMVLCDGLSANHAKEHVVLRTNIHRESGGFIKNLRLM